MARHHSLSDFFIENHADSRELRGKARRDLNKAIILAVTRDDRYAVLLLFRRWHPSTTSHMAFKRIALSKPEPLSRGKINPNVTDLCRRLTALAYGQWTPRPTTLAQATQGIPVPPVPNITAPAPLAPAPVQGEEEEEWFEV